MDKEVLSFELWERNFLIISSIKSMEDPDASMSPPNYHFTSTC